MENEWTRRIRELEETVATLKRVVEARARIIKRQEHEIERLKEAIRSEVA